MMSGTKQAFVKWAGVLAAVFAVAAMSVYFAVVGLDSADKLASVIGLFVTAAGLGLATYGIVADRRGRQAVAGDSASPASVTVTNSQGVIVGPYGHQVNIFDVPAVLSASLVTLIAALLAVGAGWLYFGWFAPNFAPNYRTQFLIDASEATNAQGLNEITTSLRKAVQNSGDQDALSLRSFGGECGTSSNTTRLTDFGGGNRQKIADAAERIRANGGPTLVRGIVEAVEDFSQPFDSKARQVNRIILVTRHGSDACDSDAGYVEREIQQRIGTAGLTLEFRFVGYQIPADQSSTLDRIATAANAPPPVYAKNAAELDRAIDWFANAEPVLRGAQEIVNTLNATVTEVNAAVQAITDGRLDAANSTLEHAKDTVDDAGAQFDDLNDRAKGDDARDVRDRAVRLRERQKRVVDAADELLKTEQAGSPTDAQMQRFRQTATEYNDEVNGMNGALAALRAKLPRTP